MRETKRDPKTDSSWLATLGSDVTKVALGLYLLGTITSILYYSRFSILTLDFVKAQSILVGCYVLGAYLAIPFGILWVLRCTESNVLIACTFFASLLIFDLVILYAVEQRGIMIVLALATMLPVQLIAFLEGASILDSVSQRRAEFRFRLVPGKLQAAKTAILACVHFSLLIYAGIPMYLGGAKPMEVWIVTKTEGIAKTPLDPPDGKPNSNGAPTSYGKMLLYETDKDMYFLTDVKGNGVLLERIVSKIPRSEILRVSYDTPLWVTWR